MYKEMCMWREWELFVCGCFLCVGAFCFQQPSTSGARRLIPKERRLHLEAAKILTHITLLTPTLFAHPFSATGP